MSDNIFVRLLIFVLVLILVHENNSSVWNLNLCPCNGIRYDNVSLCISSIMVVHFTEQMFIYSMYNDGDILIRSHMNLLCLLIKMTCIFIWYSHLHYHHVYFYHYKQYSSPAKSIIASLVE